MLPAGNLALLRRCLVEKFAVERSMPRRLTERHAKSLDFSDPHRPEREKEGIDVSAGSIAGTRTPPTAPSSAKEELSRLASKWLRAGHRGALRLYRASTLEPSTRRVIEISRLHDRGA